MDKSTPLIDDSFVKEWAVRYRRGAEATVWRGSGLKAAMGTRSDRQALDALTNSWALEEHIFQVIGPSVRAAGHYTTPQFLTVAYWKTPRQLPCYVMNSAPAVDQITRHALAAPTTSEMVSGLKSLHGVGVPVASALLTVWDPDKFSIVDVWALATLSRAGEAVDEISFGSRKQGWWEHNYPKYLQGCRTIADRVRPLALRDVDRALWKWGKTNAGRYGQD